MIKILNFTYIETSENKIKLPCRSVILILCLIILSACTAIKKHDQDAGPTRPVDWSKVKPAIPKKEVPSRYGNPESYEVYGITYRTLNSSENFKQKGVASWYGTKFHGRRTSSGEPYDMLKLTAAHKTLPIPSYVRVTNKDNGRSLIVRVNDRGPFVKSRIIDLSYAAAHQLGMAEKGTANVEIEAINFESTVVIKPKLVKKTTQVKKPRAVPSESYKGRYIQVGAYSQHKNAQKLARVLDREIQLPVTVNSILRAGQKLYRVRIGPILSLDIAEQLTEVLNLKELGKPSIVYED